MLLRDYWELTLVRSLSIKLLAIVLTVYFILTILVTAVHVYIEYRHAQNEVYTVVEASENNFKHKLAFDLLNEDYEQLKTSAKSIIGLPHISGVVITSGQTDNIVSVGTISNDTGQEDNFISHSFPLFNTSKNTTTEIGTITFYSNKDFIINNVQQSLFLLLVNAAINIAAVFILISVAFKLLLSTPLKKLTTQVSKINPSDLDSSKITVARNHEDELGTLQKALNAMISKTSETISSLDAANKSLEYTIEEKTDELNKTIAQLNEQHSKLENEIDVRQKSEKELECSLGNLQNAQSKLIESEKELEKSLNELQIAQSQLIESEKMAALGRLVAGVAHEINTPVGLSLTGISHFQTTVQEIARLFEEGELEESDFTRFINESQELSTTIQNSLQRAADLIRSFKLVAVDQSAEQIRQFDIIQYLNETMMSLKNKLKQSKVVFVINTQSDPLIINNYPGSWAQIFTNFIQNTLIHAYDVQSEGKVELNFYTKDSRLIFEFIDDGKGMCPESIDKIFEPFYTTNRANGGSGLGMNVVFNIVQQKMFGTISVESQINKGTKFVINVPIDIQSKLEGDENGLI